MIGLLVMILQRVERCSVVLEGVLLMELVHPRLVIQSPGSPLAPLLDCCFPLKSPLSLLEQGCLTLDQLNVLNYVYPTSPDVRLVVLKEVGITSRCVDVLCFLDQGFKVLALLSELCSCLDSVLFNDLE